MRLNGGQVLEAMHGKVDTFFVKGAFYFLHKYAIAANLRERHMRDAITGGANLLYGYLQVGPLLLQALDDQFRLYHRQLAGPRAYRYLFH